MDGKFTIDHKKKINKCLNCKYCDLNFTLTEDDDFWYSVRCNKECPDELNFDCMQCLLCSHFEQCCRDFKIQH